MNTGHRVGPHSPVRIRPLSEADAREIAAWSYPAPYSACDIGGVTPDSLARLMAGDHYALESESGELVGYFCLGEHARVPGGRYDAAAVDLGLGLRPDLAGDGRGAAWVRAVLTFVKEQQATPRVRATIATWNKRALAVAARIGFRQVGSFGGFRRGAAGHYVVLVADL